MNTPDTRPRLLLVDDEPANLETLIALLEDDYALSVATSGPEALALLAADARPALVLLDVMMPDMDGYEVCARIKAEPATRDLPILFVTARTDAESESRALTAGAVDFIHKPVNRLVLRARVRLQLELLRHRDHLEELVHERTLELAGARDEARAADRAKGAFLATMSHEMRTPMNQIMGLAHLLGNEVAGARGHDYLAKLQSASKRLLGIVEDLIDFSRTESGTLAIDRIDFELPRLLRRLVDDFTARAAARGLRLDLDLDAGIPARLRGDPLRINQVLAIGLSNAVKFSARGAVRLGISPVAASGEAVTLRFEITDEGGGVPPEVRGRLFESFSPGDNSVTRAHGGIGLELALARRLVTLMGGELGLETREGEGSTYWFELRLGRAPATPAAPALAFDPLAATAAVAYLDALLADGDFRALMIWKDVADLLGPLFGDSITTMREALEACDFALARAQLAGAAVHLPPVP